MQHQHACHPRRHIGQASQTSRTLLYRYRPEQHDRVMLLTGFRLETANKHLSLRVISPAKLFTIFSPPAPPRATARQCEASAKAHYAWLRCFLTSCMVAAQVVFIIAAQIASAVRRDCMICF